MPLFFPLYMSALHKNLAKRQRKKVREKYVTAQPSKKTGRVQTTSNRVKLFAARKGQRRYCRMLPIGSSIRDPGLLSRRKVRGLIPIEVCRVNADGQLDKVVFSFHFSALCLSFLFRFSPIFLSFIYPSPFILIFLIFIFFFSFFLFLLLDLLLPLPLLILLLLPSIYLHGVYH